MNRYKPGFKSAIAAIVFLTSATVVSTSSDSAHGVTYGDEIVDASVSKPWVASIWFARDLDSLLDFSCSGSLISPQIVLTAAHCVDGYGIYYVQLKSNTLEGDSLLIQADATWKSPRYNNRNVQNDLGLIYLSEPVYDVKPVRVAKKSATRVVDTLSSFTIYGWGRDQNGELASFLRYSKLESQREAARSKFTSKQFNDTTTIAAGKYLRDERVYSGGCRGDSGGPLTARIKGVETLVGITSYGARSCRAKVPTVFTKVSYYEKDIRNGVRNVIARAAQAVRTAPTAIRQPSITGNPVRGGTVTCDPGFWNPGTLKISTRWSADNMTIRDPSVKSVLLPTLFFGQTVITCEVTASNAYGYTTIYVSAVAQGVILP